MDMRSSLQSCNNFNENNFGPLGTKVHSGTKMREREKIDTHTWGWRRSFLVSCQVAQQQLLILKNSQPLGPRKPPLKHEAMPKGELTSEKTI